jgi:hypothetical protein
MAEIHGRNLQKTAIRQIWESCAGFKLDGGEKEPRVIGIRLIGESEFTETRVLCMLKS